MDKVNKLHPSTTLMIPPVKQRYSKKHPPVLVPLKNPSNGMSVRVPVYTKSTYYSFDNSENSNKPQANFQRLPKVKPISEKERKSEIRVHYTKWIPKIHYYKPVLQDRTKSHGYPSDEDEDYINIKSKLPWIDYMSD